MKMANSKIFSSFRAVGLISNHVPLDVRYDRKHKESYVVTCVGRAYHTYKCSNLGITSISNNHAEEISCLAVDGGLVYTAYGNTLSASSKRQTFLHTYSGHTHPISIILPFGRHVISVDVESNFKVWDVNAEEVFLEMNFDMKTFHITALVHPATYVNKVLLASQQGTMQLWNISSSKLVYTFVGWQSAVIYLEQAPATDVIAAGLADGRIVLHNLKYDETLMSFKQEYGPVTAISFRTDGQPIMITGTTVGHLCFWNLNERKLISEKKNAHNSSVSGLKCLPSEPLLVTSSSDNALKVWIMDQPDSGARLLHMREGHSAPPTKIAFFSKRGDDIITAGQDCTVRSFSTVHDSNNFSLGKASLDRSNSKKSSSKKGHLLMPPVVNFAVESSRKSDWDNVVACHSGLCDVTTWNHHKRSMGQHRLKHQRFSRVKDEIAALAVTVTSCGNFAIIGYSSGHIDLFNIQSGLHRHQYGQPTGHTGAVRGIAVDDVNRYVISAGADNLVKFWNFKSEELITSVAFDCQIKNLLLHRESALLAAVRDDFTISVLDIDTKHIVRNFVGHKSSIIDQVFSTDCHWLISAAMDCTIRVWNLSIGKLVDCFSVPSAVSSMAFSPTSLFLATSHIGELGIYLWTNKTISMHVSLPALPDNFEAPLLDLPGIASPQPIEQDDEEDSLHDTVEYSTTEQLHNELITLSQTPLSMWKGLLNIDVIRERNKPKQVKKPPKPAPFFLPTTPGLNPMFVLPEKDREEKSNPFTSFASTLTAVGQKLMNANDAEAYMAIFKELSGMGTSAVEIELLCLGPESTGSTTLLLKFFELIIAVSKTRSHYELTQAYLARCLKLHGSVIAANSELSCLLDEVLQLQKENWCELRDLLDKSLSSVNYLRSII